MTGSEYGLGRPPVAALRLRWLGLGAVSLLSTVVTYALVAATLGLESATRWLSVVAGLLLLGLGWMWWMLPRNHGADEPVRSTFGPGTWVTAFRGMALAHVAGLLLVPSIGGPLRWLPAILYGVVVVGDVLDGILARATDHVTVLGARLDTEIDALGILVAALLGVLAGSVPLWYLTAGLARYGFVAGRAVRRRRERPVYPLPPRRSRRALAGLQMAYLVFALAPPTDQPLTAAVGAAVLLPFLGGFVRDWSDVAGYRTSTSSAADSETGSDAPSPGR